MFENATASTDTENPSVLFSTEAGKSQILTNFACSREIAVFEQVKYYSARKAGPSKLDAFYFVLEYHLKTANNTLSTLLQS